MTEKNSGATKYTPGPWEVSPTEGATYFVHAELGMSAMVMGGVYTAKETVAADARLIAAAPDAYEVCLAVLRSDGSAYSFQVLADLAREVISRVEGPIKG